MANQEHLAKLKEGAEAWNKWRREYSDTWPDLKKADLTGANLQGYFLERTNLWEAILFAAQLQGASLIEADLQKADLRDAFFDVGTRLQKAVLSDEQSVFGLVADLSWGGVNLAVVDWTAVKMLGDEYEAGQLKTREGKIKERSERIDDYRAAVRANRQLAVVLRDQGLNEEADRFAYRARRLQRIVLRRQGLFKKATLWQRVRKLGAYVSSGFLDLLAGYGYHPAKTFLWYLLVIGGFATAYAVFGHLPPLPDALVFSFMSFHGRGFFPSLTSEMNLHNPLVVFAAAEAVLGLLIEISLISTFTQRFFAR